MSEQVQPDRIEPGDKFKIGYGRGHQIEVVGLNYRQLKRGKILMANVTQANTAETVMQVIDELLEFVRVCAPGITDEQIDAMDDQMMVELIVNTMSKARLSEDELKKSESPLT